MKWQWAITPLPKYTTTSKNSDLSRKVNQTQITGSLNTGYKYQIYWLSGNISMFNGAKVQPQRAQAIGRLLFTRYDYDKKGALDKNQCYSLFADTVYRPMSLQNPPNHQQSDTMFSILDSNRDNRVSLDDLEALAVRYLCPHLQGPRAPPQPKPKILTTVARNRLDVARRLFEQFDKDKSGFLTQAQVPLIMIETYKDMGQTFIPTKDDVDSWMKMTDTNRDGKVTFQEYEDLVFMSLQKCGIQIYK